MQRLKYAPQAHIRIVMKRDFIAPQRGEGLRVVGRSLPNMRDRRDELATEVNDRCSSLIDGFCSCV